MAGSPEDMHLDGRASLRNARGTLPDFHEIVTPHPVVAFLFRRRTFIVLLGIIAMIPWSRPQPVALGIGFAIAAAAEAWRIWAAGTIHKTEELTTSGPYARVRHPLYVGSFLHAIALCCMTGLWQSALIILPMFAVLYSAAAATEEAMLYKVFGERYAEYCRNVPRLVPRLRPWGNSRSGFDWQRVRLNKEYVNLIWIAALSGIFLGKLLIQGGAP